MGRILAREETFAAPEPAIHVGLMRFNGSSWPIGVVDDRVVGVIQRDPPRRKGILEIEPAIGPKGHFVVGEAAEMEFIQQ